MNLWLLGLEPHDSRYTKQWRDHIPVQLERAARRLGRDDIQIRIIEGAETDERTTPGAFLNFAGTNIYKSSQIMKVAQAFQDGLVQPHDHFLVTDAWHPGIIQIRYMSDLLGIPVEIHALWHAGSYDPSDILGREIPDKRWSFAFERALFHAIDVNYFATDFHIGLFKAGLGIDDGGRIVRAGWPTEHIRPMATPYRSAAKRPLVTFPHRLAPEKQVEIFDDLAQEFPEYEFYVSQRHRLTKAEYYKGLGESLLVFSCSQQETLGLGIFEGMLCGAVPLVPDRLSYAEIYPGEFRYPSEWTKNWDAYLRHKQKLCEHLRVVLDQITAGGSYKDLGLIADRLEEKFFCGNAIYEKLLS